MAAESSPIIGKEYRIPKGYVMGGVLGIALFGFMGFVGARESLRNEDRSIPDPVGFAVAIGVAGSCFVLFYASLILAYFRHRLNVNPTTVRVTGFFSTRQARLANITHAVWKSPFDKSSSLILKENGIAVKITFTYFTDGERRELISFFREALAGCQQEGWERFASRNIPRQVDHNLALAQARRNLRFSAIAWSVAIPVMCAILAWEKLENIQPNPNWFQVGIFPLVMASVLHGAIWLEARRIRNAAKKHSGPSRQLGSGAPIHEQNESQA